MELEEVKKLLYEMIERIKPSFIIPKKVMLEGKKLYVNDFQVNLAEYDRIFVVGAGKSTGLMAEEIERILGDLIEGGVISVLHGTANAFRLRRIRVIEASHPYPDKNSVRASEEILSIADEASEKDLIIALISGGGSALMAYPYEPITLEEKIETIKTLMLGGADIFQLNTVRKHISLIKGGRLAERAYPSFVLSLIFSDVVGDKIDVIASGPTAPDSSTYKDAFEVLHDFGINRFPKSVSSLIMKGMRGEIKDTPKPGDKIFEKVKNIILANNEYACKVLKTILERLGWRAEIITTYLQGEAREVAKLIAGIAKEVYFKERPFKKPIALIFGGETTVTVRGSGRGGRNQELALAIAHELDGLNIIVATIGTDGIDGNSPAAGGVITGKFAWEHRDEIKAALKENDSYTFLKRYNLTVETGPTFTNLNDVVLLLIP